MIDLQRFRRSFQNIAAELRELPAEIFAYQRVSLNQMDYDSYWDSIGSFEWFPPRIPVIAKHVDLGASVLDLGCGNGTLLSYLAQTRQAQVSGIDVSVQALALARKKGLNCLRQADLSASNFNLDGIYDYIVITEVLEHIPDPESLMNKLRGHFNKAIIVSIPNIGFYKHRLRLLFGRFPEQWGKHPGEHLRFWTVLDFEKWVKRLGYRVVEIVPTNGFPRLFRLMPNIFAEQLVIVLQLDSENLGANI